MRPKPTDECVSYYRDAFRIKNNFMRIASKYSVKDIRKYMEEFIYANNDLSERILLSYYSKSDLAELYVVGFRGLYAMDLNKMDCALRVRGD